jgi:thioredoxin-like negative regulator of GroEL
MTDQETFEEAILRSWNEEEGAKSFVLFSSPNCAPCGRVKAAIERLEGAAVMNVGYVNVYHAAAAAMKTNIRSVPTLVKFSHGREVARLVGEQTDAKILGFVDA